MKNYVMATAVVAAAMALGSCTKDPVSKLNAEESRIYITNHDSTVSFSNFKTFSIADSVAIISNGKLKEKTSDSYDARLIAAVSEAMTQRGYTRVANNRQPDLGININNIINTYTGFVDYGNYYDGYYGYWDPYYWGYPGYGYYGSYIGTYQVNEGVISIDMFDLKDASANTKIKSVWNAVVRGEGIFNEASIGTSVQAVFSQSDYLKTNQ
jgi:Domain of unknown function (DUF4136)